MLRLSELGLEKQSLRATEPTRQRGMHRTQAKRLAALASARLWRGAPRKGVEVRPSGSFGHEAAQEEGGHSEAEPTHFPINKPTEEDWTFAGPFGFSMRALIAATSAGSGVVPS